MKKILFVFTVVLMLLAVVFLAACQSEEDKAGEAYLTTKTSCTKANVGARMCRIDLAWKCSKTILGRYSWTKTKERCNVPTCTDSDGGLNYTVKGTTSGPDIATGKYVKVEDRCTELGSYSPQPTGPRVGEMYCYNGKVHSDFNYICPNGCSNGACISVASACTPPAPPTCLKILGVCAGKTKTCVGTTWTDCTAANYGLDYEATETKCTDAKDNDCDGLTDSADSNCVSIDTSLCIEAIPGHNNIDENRINIVFVGINYNELAEPISSKDSFIFNVNKILDANQMFGMLSVEPFKSNKDKFNFWYVDEIGRVEFQEPSGLGGTNVAYDEAKRLTEMCPFVNKETIALINWGFTPVSFEKISLIPMPDIVPTNPSPVSYILLHEFGHSFASLTDEYIGTPPSLAGESLSRDGLLTGDYSSMMRVLSCPHVCIDGSDSCCSILTTHCFYSTDVVCNDNNNCTPASIKGCERDYDCTSTTASIEDCERNAEWRDLIGNGCGQDGIVDCTEPICSAKGVCSGGDPDYNLEISCQNLGCGFIDAYSATPHSIMRYGGYYLINTERGFGQNNERILCRKIKSLTGSVGGICDTICLDGCPDGQRCIQGTCQNV